MTTGMDTDKERVERIAKDMIRYVRECERQDAETAIPTDLEKVEKHVLDCLWFVYHMKDEVKTPTG